MSTCKNCKHWMPSNRSVRRSQDPGNTCKSPLLTQGYGVKAPADNGALIEYDEEWGIITGAEFGCINFEDKPVTIERVDITHVALTPNGVEPGGYIEKSEEPSMIANQLELAREDLECVHKWLDDMMAPRLDVDSDNRVFSIVGRMKALLRKMAEVRSNS